MAAHLRRLLKEIRVPAPCAGAFIGLIRTNFLAVLHLPLLGWHRQMFRWYWRQRSKPASLKPKLAAETIDLIKTMALNNRLCGAERIRGELLKLGIRVSKRTIQKYMQRELVRPSSQTWSTFFAEPCARDLGVGLLASH